MKRDTFKMEGTDDKPFQCTATGCGQVIVAASNANGVVLPGGVWK